MSEKDSSQKRANSKTIIPIVVSIISGIVLLSVLSSQMNAAQDLHNSVTGDDIAFLCESLDNDPELKSKNPSWYNQYCVQKLKPAEINDIAIYCDFLEQDRELKNNNLQWYNQYCR